VLARSVDHWAGRPGKVRTVRLRWTSARSLTAVQLVRALPADDVRQFVATDLSLSTRGPSTGASPPTRRRSHWTRPAERLTPPGASWRRSAFPRSATGRSPDMRRPFSCHRADGPRSSPKWTEPVSTPARGPRSPSNPRKAKPKGVSETGPHGPSAPPLRQLAIAASTTLSSNDHSSIPGPRRSEPLARGSDQVYGLVVV
jgi:hypothetical protein